MYVVWCEARNSDKMLGGLAWHGNRRVVSANGLCLWSEAVMLIIQVTRAPSGSPSKSRHSVTTYAWQARHALKRLLACGQVF